jgi:hypothetical protein
VVKSGIIPSTYVTSTNWVGAINAFLM